MPERARTMQTIKATAARQQFSELVNQVFRREKRVLIEKSGIPVAALISAEDLERLVRLEAERERDFAVLDEVGRAFEDVPSEELDREVRKAVASVRATTTRSPKRRTTRA
jgi:prevent-host-death family protein